ncbi:hypothetical protein B0T14DRAFT_165607 [Immersiella caudata]|uniref:Uncharacterized protein n=1 Tax=Immersiella caudata TaxID=314043 RepID=A0AA39WX36_9PEZI|nr:hypothetical protein B0T14DRAFT_165607 [Immersiella caudata]
MRTIPAGEKKIRIYYAFCCLHLNAVGPCADQTAKSRHVFGHVLPHDLDLDQAEATKKVWQSNFLISDITFWRRASMQNRGKTGPFHTSATARTGDCQSWRTCTRRRNLLAQSQQSQPSQPTSTPRPLLRVSTSPSGFVSQPSAISIVENTYNHIEITLYSVWQPAPKRQFKPAAHCTQVVTMRDFARHARYPQPGSAPPRQTT